MPAPRTFGNKDIARQIKSGSCRLLIVGDSIHGSSSGGMIQAISQCWRPDNFVGWGQIAGLSVTSGGLTFDNTLGGGFGATAGYTGWESTGGPAAATGGPNSIPGWMYGSSSIRYGHITTFNGVAVPADTSPFFNRMAEFNLLADAVYYPWYKWFSARALRFSYTCITNSLACQSYLMRARNRTGSVTYTSVTGLNARTTPVGFQTTDLDLSSTTYAGTGDEPSISIQPTGGTTPANGNNMVHVCCRMRVQNATGLELIPLGIGGSKASDWAASTAVDQTMQNGWISALGVNVVYIWLGQNDGGTSTKAQYKANILALMNRFIVSNPAMRFVLCSPYQTDPTSWTGSGLGNSAEPFADALYEIAQTMSDRVLFINTWRLLGDEFTAAGKYGFLNAKVLTDSVHPTTAGNLFIQQLVWAQIEQANAEANNQVFRYRPKLR